MTIVPVQPTPETRITATDATRRTFGWKRPSRRTFARLGKPSRRTFGRRGVPSRRTFGRRVAPSCRTFG